jgi:aryl-alcohol dehydrogenase-like predicted oxidoreductase
MQTTTLGRTGLKVSRLGLGGGGPSQLGQSTGVPVDDSTEIIRLALDYGVNFIDTAEAYRTESLIGQAIRGVSRDQLILSTKKTTWGEYPITPADVRTSLEASLKNLETDYVDIYNLHAVTANDYDYQMCEIFPALQKLKGEGKIRFIGITEAFHTDPGHEMLQCALKDDIWDVIMVGFNILNQSARQRVLADTILKNIGIQVMFAVRLALSRPERLKEVTCDLIARGQLDESEVDRDDPLGFVITEGGAVSIPDAAYRFCRDEPGTHVILSGTGSIEHMRANLESIERQSLPEAVTQRLRSIFRNVDSISGQ